jgi:hypothetical protein
MSDVCLTGLMVRDARAALLTMRGKTLILRRRAQPSKPSVSEAVANGAHSAPSRRMRPTH